MAFDTYGDVVDATNKANYQRLVNANYWPAYTASKLGLGSTDATNPFRQWKNVKESDLDASYREALKKWTGLGLADIQPTFTRDVRDPELRSKINAKWSDLAKNTSDTRQTVEDFASKLLQSEKEQEGQLGTEAGAVNRWYDRGGGGVEAELAGSRGEWKRSALQALRDQTTRNIAAANRGALFGGTNSLVNATMGSTNAQAAVGLNQALSEQRRKDIYDVNAMRANLVDRINSARRAINAQRAIIPGLQMQVNAQDMAGFGQLTNAQLANQLLYQNPTTADLMRAQLAGIQGAGQGILGNTEYTYESPDNPNVFYPAYPMNLQGPAGTSQQPNAPTSRQRPSRQTEPGIWPGYRAVKDENGNTIGQVPDEGTGRISPNTFPTYTGFLDRDAWGNMISRVPVEGQTWEDVVNPNWRDVANNGWYDPWYDERAVLGEGGWESWQPDLGQPQFMGAERYD